MKLKLSEWASVAEIVSGIAVVVTLIFLVLGIRENTGVTRLSIYSDIIDGFNDMEARIWADPELTLLFDAYISEQTDRLSEQEQTRVGLIALTQFRGLEKAFFANEYGAIGPDEWERIQASICSNYGRARSIGMNLLDQPVLTQPFRDFLDENCEADV